MDGVKKLVPGPDLAQFDQNASLPEGNPDPAPPAPARQVSAKPPSMTSIGRQQLRVLAEEYENLRRWRDICLLVTLMPELRAQLRRPDLPGKEAMDRLLRYESVFERQFYKAMDQLERRQRQRRGEAVPPPVNAHVEIE